MVFINILVAFALFALIVFPEIPFSRLLLQAGLAFGQWVKKNATLGRALIGISVALLIYAAVWALAGDAPAVLAMVLPELAGWFATFEIGTLVDAVVAIGIVAGATRLRGLSAYTRHRIQQRRRRQRRTPETHREAQNDDEPGAPLRLAA